MRMIGSLPSLRSSRNPAVGLLIAVLVIFAAYETARLVLSGDTTELGLVALVFVAGAVVVTILNDWHR